MRSPIAIPPKSELLNEDISLRRLIWHARDYDRAFDIQPWPPIAAEEDAAPPAPLPQVLDFHVMLDSDKLAALDRGEVIHLIVANRRCLVRLRDPPSG